MHPSLRLDWCIRMDVERTPWRCLEFRNGGVSVFFGNSSMKSWIPNLPSIKQSKASIFGGVKDLDVHRIHRWSDCFFEASWYGVLHQGVGGIVSTCRCRFLHLLQVMATNVMGPALLTKAFFLMGWKLTEKGIWISLMAYLAHIQWWILGVFIKIKHWHYTTVMHSSFKNAWMRSWLHRQGFVQKGFLNRDEAHKCWWHHHRVLQNHTFLQKRPADIYREFVVKPETGVVPTAKSCFKGRAK